MVAESWLNPAEWYLTNIVAKAKLHEILKSTDSLNRYVRVSTPEVYGSHNDVQSESWSLNPSTPYAVSHAAIDLSLRTQFQQYKFPVVFTRFANFYGPAQQLYRIVPRTIIQALTGGVLNLHGGGRSVRAFIYGDDVASAIRVVAEKGVPGEIYHFSTDEFVSIKELVKMVCKELKVEPETFVKISPDRPGKDLAYLMSSDKAKKQLGWAAKTNLESGIQATIDWVKSNLSEIKALPQEYIHKP
jgi:dTDP-glucose 4,6-dehydratase